MTDRSGDLQQGPSEEMPGSLSPPVMRHDALFREAFSDPERADVLLRWVLPDSIVSSFADEPPEVQSTTFVADNLTTTQCDVLLKVRLKNGKDACFPIILEHKSGNDPWTILQVGGYMLSTWQRIATQDRLKPGELPPILPLVFYHGDEPWTAPTSLKEAMDFKGLSAEAFPCGIWYILCNIREVPLEELPKHPEVLPVLIAFRGAELELMVPLLGAMGVHSKLGKRLLLYAMWRHGKSAMGKRILALPEVQRNEMEAEMHAEMHSMIETSRREGKTEGRTEGRSEGLAEGRSEGLAEGRSEGLAEGRSEGLAEGRSEGLAEGRAEGRSEGLAEGRSEGLANALLRVLERRFGPLRPGLRDRVSSASLDQLQRWFDNALDARSPEEAISLPNTH